MSLSADKQIHGSVNHLTLAGLKRRKVHTDEETKVTGVDIFRPQRTIKSRVNPLLVTQTPSGSFQT